MEAGKKREWITEEGARRALKASLWIYIVLCVLIAGLNYGYAPKAPPRAAAILALVYRIYENEFKALLILVCAALSWRILGKRARLQRLNLVFFACAALALHVVLPLALRNHDVYYVYMPLPWSSTGLQFLDPASGLYRRMLPLWGGAGLAAAALVFVAGNAFVFLGTLLLGRRWQCSALCLLNGFVAEVWGPVIPLVGKKKTPGGKARRFLAAARWSMFALSLAFVLWWCSRLAGIRLPGDPDSLAGIENLKYLILELLAAMSFWALWSGRGYCHYCPAGTALSFLARLAGQRIAADKGKCVSCGACSRACPMLIDVAGRASRGEASRDGRCVGCGRCVDSCPTRALRYETAFLRALRRFRAPRRG